MKTFLSQSYFEENLRDIYDDDEFTFTTGLREAENANSGSFYDYNGYVKTIPEDELLVDFDNDCEFTPTITSLSLNFTLILTSSQ